MNLTSALWLDTIAVATSLTLVLLRGGSRASDVAIVYWAFHVLIFTQRAWSLSLGSKPFLPLSESQYGYALIIADLALLAFTFGWIAGPAKPHSHKNATVMLNDTLLKVLALITIPVGMLVLLSRARIPNVDAATNTPSATAYESLPASWPGLALVILIYRYGFRWYYTTPLMLYLTLIAVQGYGRYRLILPCILLLFIWLDRKDLRWPKARMLLPIALVFFAFFPLKDVGQLVQQGTSASEIFSTLGTSTNETLRGQSSDQVIFDQLAATIVLARTTDSLYLGEPYLAIATLPIPRVIWTDKPGLADHLSELSTSSLPLDKLGGVTTLPGDLYLNFAAPGVAIVMAGLGRIAYRAREKSYSKPYLSVYRFAYLLVVSVCIQVSRDGLLSLPLFILVHSFPLTALAVGSVLISRIRNSPVRRRRSKAPNTNRRMKATG